MNIYCKILLHNYGNGAEKRKKFNEKSIMILFIMYINMYVRKSGSDELHHNLVSGLQLLILYPFILKTCHPALTM